MSNVRPQNVRSLFSLRRKGNAIVARSEDDFFARFERMSPPRSVFAGQMDQHAEADLRLVGRIEELLVPLLGQWERSTAWFHQLDFHGDGVRSLTFRRDIFPRGEVQALQALLADEHAQFTILCSCSESLLPPKDPAAKPPTREWLGIFSKQLLVTRGLANELSLGA